MMIKLHTDEIAELNTALNQSEELYVNVQFTVGIRLINIPLRNDEIEIVDKES